MSEWQPIEKAPKHKAVLVYSDGYCHAIAVFSSMEFFAMPDKDIEQCIEDCGEEAFFHIAWYDALLSVHGYPVALDFEPTHWMPLPEPPKP